MEGLLKGLARVAANERGASKPLMSRGCRFVGWQIAACGSTKVGCREQSRNNGGPSSDKVITPCP
ncbi:conserved domain protein [Actinomyces sp. oral taxon 175 str. F0384]|nr:conserved domain protein [Actinomyces sp. oral taxon 175 str. F0384]